MKTTFGRVVFAMVSTSLRVVGDVAAVAVSAQITLTAMARHHAPHRVVRSHANPVMRTDERHDHADRAGEHRSLEEVSAGDGDDDADDQVDPAPLVVSN